MKWLRELFGGTYSIGGSQIKPAIAESSDLYANFIETTKERLSNYSSADPLKVFLYDNELQKNVNKISIKDSEIYWKSRFLGGLLNAVWAIQWRTQLERDREEAISRNWGEIKTVSVFKRVLYMEDPQLQQEVLEKGVGVATIAIENDPEVDLKVAQDLGRGPTGYPGRPPLPAKENKDEMFRITTLRVRLFWQTILPIPVYPLLYKLTSAPHSSVTHKTEGRPEQSERHSCVAEFCSRCQEDHCKCTPCRITTSEN